MSEHLGVCTNRLLNAKCYHLQFATRRSVATTCNSQLVAQSNLHSVKIYWTLKKIFNQKSAKRKLQTQFFRILIKIPNLLIKKYLRILKYLLISSEWLWFLLLLLLTKDVTLYFIFKFIKKVHLFSLCYFFKCKN